MKALVVLLTLLTTTPQSGVGAGTVKINTYNATGELDISKDPFTLGTRVILTCDVTGLPESSEGVSYRWYHNCTVRPNSRCEIRDGDPYYRVVNDTLLVDVTSLDQGGRYYCTVQHQQDTQMAVTRELAVAGNRAPFLYTATSLLPEHSVLTDVQQATGRDGQQWITCRSGGRGTRPEIWMGSEEVVPSTSTASSATIVLGTQRPNGLYHCLSGQSQREYFSLFFTNTATLPTPSVQSDSLVWTLTSPDGRRVKRYIVEFECRVRSITFVEKYMSVSASGGTGRVATNVSYFGGLGQLYRVKVWAVSGPNISPALVCHIPDGQCREEEGGTSTPTITTPVSKGTTTLGNTGGSLTTPTGPQASSTAQSDVQLEGTFIGVGVGVGVFILLVLSTVVVVILVVVIVKRKAARKQKMYNITRASLWYHNSVVVEHEEEKEEKVVVSADNDEGGSYQDVDIDKGEDDNPLDGFISYEVIDWRQNIKNTKTPAPTDSPTPASAPNGPAVYGVVNKKKKRGAKKTENGFTVASNDPRNVMPMKKMATMTVKEEGVVMSGGVEEEEKCET